MKPDRSYLRKMLLAAIELKNFKEEDFTKDLACRALDRSIMLISAAAKQLSDTAKAELSAIALDDILALSSAFSQNRLALGEDWYRHMHKVVLKQLRVFTLVVIAKDVKHQHLVQKKAKPKV